MTGKGAEKLVEKYDKLKGEEDAKWQKEIELLETRVQSNFKDIAIDDKGGTIAIRASLSDAETGKIAKLDRERLKLGTKDKEGNIILTDKEIAEVDALTFEILEIVMANPLMTKKWFATNRDKYSTEDMLKVTLGYYDEMAARVQRVSSIKEFRTTPARTELR